MYFIGLDLGQLNDPTAVAVIEVPDREDRPPTYDIRHLQRFQLGTPYPVIVEKIIKLRDRLNLGHPIRPGDERDQHPVNKCILIIDATGVGRPVVDLFRMAGLGPVAVTITGGIDAYFGGKERAAMWTSSSLLSAQSAKSILEWSIPKKDLVGVLNVLFQNRMLKIARSLPEAGILTQELMNFKIKINTQTKHESFEAWREGIHDDLVLAVAMAVYAATRGRGPKIPLEFADSKTSIPDVWGDGEQKDPFGRPRRRIGTPIDEGLPGIGNHGGGNLPRM